MKIYKYELIPDENGIVKVELPKEYYTYLKVDAQPSIFHAVSTGMFLWCMIPDDDNVEKRIHKFRIITTGEKFDPKGLLRHIDTVLMAPYVFHVFSML